MKVLVTGSAGFIGSAIARACGDKGWDTTTFDNLMKGFESAVPEGATLMRGDGRDQEAVACEGVDLIFHQGTLRSVTRSVDEPELTLDCNIGSTLNVLTGENRWR